jgi:putative spermidine/putrescine transport system permease protein
MRVRQIWTPWLLIGPVLFVFVVFFALPTLLLLLTSFQRVDLVSFQIIEQFTFYQFTRFFTDLFYLGVLGNTLKISLLATLLCLVAGYPVAVCLTRMSPRERAILMLLILSPLLVSVVVLSFGWIIIVAPTGLVNTFLVGVGLVEAPLELHYTEPAVVVGLAHVYYPFMVLAVYNSLRNIDPEVVRAARSLGASPARAFWKIVLPLSVPGALAGSFIIFALCVSSFVTPTLLGGPWVKMMAFLAWQQQIHLLDWPFGAAITVILLVTTGLIMVVYNRLIERWWFAGVFHSHRQ